MSRILKSLIAVVAVGLTIAGIAAAASTPAVTAESADQRSPTTTATLTRNDQPQRQRDRLQLPVRPDERLRPLDQQPPDRRRHPAGHRAHQHRGADARHPLPLPRLGAQRRGYGVGHRQDLHDHRTSARRRGHRAAVNVGKTVATATGSINPQGAATTWAVQYGVSTNYGSQTIPAQPLAAVATSLPVSAMLVRARPRHPVPLPARRLPRRQHDLGRGGRDVLHRAQHAAQAAADRPHLPVAGSQEALRVHDHGQARRRQEHPRRLQVLGHREPEVLHRRARRSAPSRPRSARTASSRARTRSARSTPPPRPGSRSRSTSTATATSPPPTSRTR